MSGTDASLQTNAPLDEQQKKAWMWVIGLGLVVLYCYWNSFESTAETWTNSTYNHGYLIPVFSIFLLWHWRQPFKPAKTNEIWIAVAIIAAATAIRVFVGTVYFTIDRLSFLACITAVFLFVGGFRCLRWSGPAIAFSVFMFPWPGWFSDNVMRPMQRIATMMSTYSLQTLGIDAYQDGNRIILEHTPLNVAEQCSGLRMLTIFIALSVAMAMISSHRPMWERILVVLSSPPIALLVNSIRITVIGFLTSMELGGEPLQRIFHDFAGLIMMPLAIGFLFLEMYILARVVIEDKQETTLAPGLQ